jgi:hypothetical protein
LWCGVARSIADNVATWAKSTQTTGIDPAEAEKVQAKKSPPKRAGFTTPQKL